MRSQEEIIADPLASDAEVSSLEPEDAILHPNCPVERWWKLAKECPLEAIGSIPYLLFTLESPGRWVALQQENLDDWVFLVAARRLRFTNQQLFLADCVEYLSRDLKDQIPSWMQPVIQQAIAARRNYANYQIDPMQWMFARSQVSANQGPAEGYKLAWPLVNACAMEDTPRGFLYYFPKAYINAKWLRDQQNLPGNAQMEDAQMQALEWAWTRVLGYLRKNSPELEDR